MGRMFGLTKCLVVAGGNIAAIVLTASVASGQVAESPKPEEVVEEALRACNDGQPDGYVHAHDPGASIHLVFEDTAVVWLHGAEQIGQWAAWTCPRSRVQVLDAFISHNLVFQRERWWDLGESGENSARHTHTRVYLVDQGSILRQWVYPWESSDPAYVPPVEAPRFPEAGGPTVYIDHAHANGHTMEGTYWPLAELLRRDGYVVAPWPRPFTDSLPPPSSILIIANPGVDIAPQEVRRMREWVEGGGGLLLITDHSPGPERVKDLARAFDIEFRSGFVLDTVQAAAVFRRSDGSVGSHPITDGLDATARVDSVVTHTGSAFTAPVEARPLLRFPETMAFFKGRGMDSPESR